MNDRERATESYGAVAAWVRALPPLPGDRMVLQVPEWRSPPSIDIDDIEFRDEIAAYRDSKDNP